MKIMLSSRFATSISKRNLRSSFFFSGYSYPDRHLVILQHRSIITTSPVHFSWMDSIKGVFTGKKTSPDDPKVSAEDFTLLRFADELKNARKLGQFKKYIVGRSSDATFADVFEKQEAIIRYLGVCDPTGENLQPNQKKEAAKQCDCTLLDVENALAKFTWAKEAHKKVVQLKEEGKPMPKSFAEVQQLMGSTPLDLARSNMAKSGQISRNALCPCGSKKRYKRCCGKDQ
ncbi:asparagine--tRNA ligase [Hibiscus syriacus]|uniref:Asparagine--tRNA ligase n=1 Tax=Hibiscus syriacus TaxID=106335 RepID=A0A6A2YJH9_HIBSY|nr:protein translocase subunit SecA 1-like [Hibiscus syriacus]KAE8679299.1 asparagine--tRNA ligase [Hibiscus syriacus]